MSSLSETVLELDRRYPGDRDAEMMLGAEDWRRLVDLAGTGKRWELAVIACSSEKRPAAAPARDLYQGQSFKLALELAELLADRTVILSAKHGVVHPLEHLVPYDEAIQTKGPADRAAWGRAVSAQLRLCAARDGEVLVLAPQSYVQHIPVPRGLTWFQPMNGLGIGQQKRWLAESLESARGR